VLTEQREAEFEGRHDTNFYWFLCFTNFKGEFHTHISNGTVERQTRLEKGAVRATGSSI